MEHVVTFLTEDGSVFAECEFTDEEWSNIKAAADSLGKTIEDAILYFIEQAVADTTIEDIQRKLDGLDGVR